MVQNLQTSTRTTKTNIWKYSVMASGMLVLMVIRQVTLCSEVWALLGVQSTSSSGNTWMATGSPVTYGSTALRVQCPKYFNVNTAHIQQ